MTKRTEQRRSRTARSVRAARAITALLLCVCAGGCRFLADEFTQYDVLPPGASKAPDAPVAGAEARP